MTDPSPWTPLGSVQTRPAQEPDLRHHRAQVRMLLRLLTEQGLLTPDTDLRENSVLTAGMLDVHAETAGSRITFFHTIDGWELVRVPLPGTPPEEAAALWAGPDHLQAVLARGGTGPHHRLEDMLEMVREPRPSPALPRLSRPSWRITPQVLLLLAVGLALWLLVRLGYPQVLVFMAFLVAFVLLLRAVRVAMLPRWGEPALPEGPDPPPAALPLQALGTQELHLIEQTRRYLEDEYRVVEDHPGSAEHYQVKAALYTELPETVRLYVQKGGNDLSGLRQALDHLRRIGTADQTRQDFERAWETQQRFLADKARKERHQTGTRPLSPQEFP